MISKKKAIVTLLISGIICTIGGIVSGHATCAHQYATGEEVDKMVRDGDGEISHSTYFKTIIRGYENMYKDPLGLERELE